MKMLVNILVCITAIILSIILLEIGLRLLLPMESIFIQNDALLGYRHIPNKTGIWLRETESPNKITINSKGLRDTEHSYEKNESIFRILLLGDSYIQGLQVKTDDMLSKKLERLLNYGKKQKFEVINAGVQGYSTGIENLYFQTEGIKYNPDLIILYFFVGNDIIENYYKTASDSKPGWKLERNTLIKVNPDANPKYIWIRDKILTKSYICRAIRMSLKNMKTNSFEKITDQLGLLSGIIKPFETPQDKKEAIEVTKRLLTELSNSVKDANKALVIFLIPDGSIFYPSRFQNNLVQENEEYMSETMAFLDKNGFYYISPVSGYKQAIQDNETVYFDYYGHWSKNGHEISAKITFDFLLNNRLIPI